MTHLQPANESAATQKDIPAETTQVSSASSSTPVQIPEVSPSEDLYNYQKCTVMIVIQLRPQREADGPRSVLLSVQNGTGNKEDLPMFRLLPSEEELGGPLPPALTALLEALRQDLPARQQRHAERKAKPTVTGGTTTTTQKTKARDARKQTKPEGQAMTTSAPLPVPATTEPVPKEGLVFGGLFDDL